MMFLVAEDNAPMRDSIKRYLCTQLPDHHTVYEASDGAQAIEMFERFHPDWVLMDIAMEPVDGLTASRRVLEKFPDANIIILTNFDDAGYRAAAKKAGTKAFVLKEHLSTIGSILSPHQVGDSA